MKSFNLQFKSQSNSHTNLHFHKWLDFVFQVWSLKRKKNPNQKKILNKNMWLRYKRMKKLFRKLKLLNKCMFLNLNLPHSKNLFLKFNPSKNKNLFSKWIFPNKKLKKNLLKYLCPKKLYLLSLNNLKNLLLLLNPKNNLQNLKSSLKKQKHLM